MPPTPYKAELMPDPDSTSQHKAISQQSRRSNSTTSGEESKKTMSKSSASVSTCIEMAPTAEKNNVGIRDSIVAWDPDAEKLLRAADNEDLHTLQGLLASGIPINGHGGSFHETALHCAARIGWVEGVKYLVSSGASVYAKNQFGQTPLHYAAKVSRSAACIKLLLETNRPGVLDHRDMRGHTPLHDASGSGCANAVKLLLKAGASVNSKDGNGETPLLKAAKAQSVESMLELLNAGADLSVKDNNGESTLTHVLHHYPVIMADVFDHCLITNSPKISAKNLEVTMNFLPLTGPYEKNQVRNLQSFVDNSHAKLLTHPLCETFLQLKWMNVRKLFLIEVTFYLLFALLTTAIVFNKIVLTTGSGNKTSILQQQRGEKWSDWVDHHVKSEDIPSPTDANLCTSENEDEQSGAGIPYLPKEWEDAIIGIVLCQTAMILLQQILSLCQNKLAWFRSISGILHVIIASLVLAVVPGAVPQEWQHHLAALLQLLMWTECMLLIGRFPNCGIYVAMFTRVASVFLRIFAIYLSLLVAFSSAFYVILHSQEAESSRIFSNPFLTWIKTVTMMIGEVDFSDDIVKGLSHLNITGYVIYLLFVFLVSIVLSNLLVALAVNDVQGLRNSAHLERLIKQTELVFQMEKNFATAFYVANHVKIQKLEVLFTKVFYICKHDCFSTRVFIEPNNPKKAKKLLVLADKKLHESHLPSHLLANVMASLRDRGPDEQGHSSKSSMKIKRGSRLRHSEYNRGRDTVDISANLKELEANVIELVSEKVENVAESCTTLNRRLSAIEENLARLTELLVGNKLSSSPPSRLNSEEEHHAGENPRRIDTRPDS